MTSDSRRRLEALFRDPTKRFSDVVEYVDAECRDAVREALEEAARRCDYEASEAWEAGCTGQGSGANKCARLVRALMPGEKS